MNRLKKVMQAAIVLACTALIVLGTQIPATAYDNNLPLNPIIINPTIINGTTNGVTSTNETLNNPSIGSVDTTAAWRVVNTTNNASAVTIAAGIATTYINAPSSTAVTVTLAAPQNDGERRRVCFGGAVTTITWAVTAPASAVSGLPTTTAANTCTEAYYNAVSGVPANASGNTWYPF